MTERRTQSLARRERDSSSTWRAGINVDPSLFRPATTVRRTSAFSNSEMDLMQRNRFPSPSHVGPISFSSPVSRLEADRFLQMQAPPPSLPAISPTSTGTAESWVQYDLQAASNPFWSAAGSPTASSQSSAPPATVDLNAFSPFKPEYQARPLVQPPPLELSGRPETSQRSQFVTPSYPLKRPFGSISSEGALFDLDHYSSPSAFSSKRLPDGRWVSVSNAATPSQSSYAAHRYNLRSRQKSTAKQPSPWHSYIQATSRLSTPSPYHSGSQSLDGAGMLLSGTPSRPDHSLFSQHELQSPNVLVAPVSMPTAREPKALTYYQLAAGIAQGIPSYYYPQASSVQMPQWSAPVAEVPFSATAYPQMMLPAASGATQQPLVGNGGWNELAKCAPASWQDFSAWHQEPFNNVPATVRATGSTQLPPAFVRRSPSQII